MFGENEGKLCWRKSDLVSVVIPSLGAPHLTKTIDSLLCSDLIKVVIIVLPRGNKFYYDDERIKIVYSNIRGQVAQRAFGIKMVSTEFLILMDDDISVSSSVISNMYKFCLYNQNAAVAPVLCDNETKLPFVTNISRAKRLLYYYLFGLKKTGSFNSATITLSFVGNSEMGPQKVDWLPGGISMSRTKKAINYNYFSKIEGKAFAEDILMSYLRTKENNVEHFILPDQFAFTDLPKQRYSLNFAIQNFITRYRVARIMRSGRLYTLLVLLIESVLMFLLQKK